MNEAIEVFHFWVVTEHEELDLVKCVVGNCDKSGRIEVQKELLTILKNNFQFRDVKVSGRG